MDSSTLTLRSSLFPTEGVNGWFLLLPCFIESPVFDAVSDLGLNCLTMSLLWDARLYELIYAIGEIFSYLNIMLLNSMLLNIMLLNIMLKFGLNAETSQTKIRSFLPTLLFPTENRCKSFISK